MRASPIQLANVKMVTSIFVSSSNLSFQLITRKLLVRAFCRERTSHLPPSASSAQAEERCVRHHQKPLSSIVALIGPSPPLQVDLVLSQWSSQPPTSLDPYCWTEKQKSRHGSAAFSKCGVRRPKQRQDLRASRWREQEESISEWWRRFSSRSALACTVLHR
jgi:hypothetical protein